MDARRDNTPEELINKMMTLSAFISDNLVNVADRDLNQPEFVSTLEVLHYALKEFAAHREERVGANDSRCAMLLDSAWVLYREFYITHLRFVSNAAVQNAAHELHDMLEDFVIEAHIDINDINKILFRQNKTDKHLHLSDEVAEKHITAINIALEDLRQPKFIQADKAVLKVARILLSYYLGQYVHDIVNRQVERFAHMQNAFHLLLSFQKRWQQQQIAQKHIDALNELFARYENEASRDLEFIQDTNQFVTVTEDGLQAESEASAEIHELDDETFFQSDAEEDEIVTFNPDNAIWHEVPFFREPTPLPIYQTDSESEEELWLQVSSENVPSPIDSPYLTPRPVRSAYVSNPSLMFAHPFEGSAPIDIPHVQEDDYYNLVL